jgi:hypothetical protein
MEKGRDMKKNSTKSETAAFSTKKPKTQKLDKFERSVLAAGLYEPKDTVDTQFKRRLEREL